MLSGWSSTTRMRLVCSSCIRPTKEPLNLGDNGARLTGLGKIAIASNFHRLLAVRCQRVSCKRDDGDVPRRGVMFQYLRGLPTVDYWYGNVHQDEIGLLGSSLRDALLSVQRLDDTIAEMLENRRVDDPVVFVVFYE